MLQGLFLAWWKYFGTIYYGCTALLISTDEWIVYFKGVNIMVCALCLNFKKQKVKRVLLLLLKLCWRTRLNMEPSSKQICWCFLLALPLAYLHTPVWIPHLENLGAAQTPELLPHTTSDCKRRKRLNSHIFNLYIG